MPEIFVLVGPPASGKSTFARQLMRDQGFLCVNKDSIRKLVHGRQFVAEHEKMVDIIQSRIIAAYIHARSSFIVDNTNLDPDRLFHMLRSMFNQMHSYSVRKGEYKVTIQDEFCAVPEETLRLRDDSRGQYRVGPQVMDRMLAARDHYLSVAREEPSILSRAEAHSIVGIFGWAEEDPVPDLSQD